MLEDRFIDAETYKHEKEHLPQLNTKVDDETFSAAAYFTEAIRRHLFEQLGGEVVLRGGLTIESTLDLALQQEAVAAIKKGLEQLDRRRGYRGPATPSSPDRSRRATFSNREKQRNSARRRRKLRAHQRKKTLGRLGAPRWIMQRGRPRSPLHLD